MWVNFEQTTLWPEGDEDSREPDEQKRLNLELTLRGDLRRCKLEEIETVLLEPYASFARYAFREKYEEEDSCRTKFRRDCDRIMYSGSFRRLENKTQVTPLYGVGKHARTRLTHTLEVAQVAKSLASALGVNEDLAEAVALGHDLGHAPFGHRGERALDEAMREAGYPGFEHNEQSCRIVRGDVCWPDRPGGLNLTREVLHSLDKHGTYFRRKKRSVLEGQLVDKADQIAYHAHDLGDAFEAGVFTLEDLQSLKIWQVVEGRGLKEKINSREVTRATIDLLVSDLVMATQAKLNELLPQSAEEIEKQPGEFPCFSPEVGEALEEVKDFLWEKYYDNDDLILGIKEKCVKLKELVKQYLSGERDLPVEQVEGRAHYEMVRDYVSGMTNLEAEMVIQEIQL